MNGRLTCLAIAVAATGSLFAASPAMALPNCPTCLRAYNSCVASGRSDCDTTYAVCSRYCPVPLAATPTPAKHDKPHDHTMANKELTFLVASR